MEVLGTPPRNMRYQISGARDGQYIVTGPGNRGIEGDGYFLGVFRTPFHAHLFIRALELADGGAPILDGLMEDEG